MSPLRSRIFSAFSDVKRCVGCGSGMVLERDNVFFLTDSGVRFDVSGLRPFNGYCGKCVKAELERKLTKWQKHESGLFSVDPEAGVIIDWNIYFQKLKLWERKEFFDFLKCLGLIYSRPTGQCTERVDEKFFTDSLSCEFCFVSVSLLELINKAKK